MCRVPTTSSSFRRTTTWSSATAAFVALVSTTAFLAASARPPVAADGHQESTTESILERIGDWESENYIDLPDGVVCGMDSRQRKVVGGKNAGHGAFPFIVSLKMKSSLKHVCGGAIISSNYVLTAAHCVTNYLAPRITVSIGEHDLGSRATDKSYEINPNRIIRHKFYDSRTFANDIALVRLKTPIQWSDSVRPICLSNDTGHYEHGRLAVVAGWAGSEKAQEARRTSCKTSRCRSWTPRCARSSWTGTCPSSRTTSAPDIRKGGETRVKVTAAARSSSGRAAASTWSASCRWASAAPAPACPASTPRCRPTSTGSPGTCPDRFPVAARLFAAGYRRR